MSADYLQPPDPASQAEDSQSRGSCSSRVVPIDEGLDGIEVCRGRVRGSAGYLFWDSFAVGVDWASRPAGALAAAKRGVTS